MKIIINYNNKLIINIYNRGNLWNKLKINRTNRKNKIKVIVKVEKNIKKVNEILSHQQLVVRITAALVLL